MAGVDYEEKFRELMEEIFTLEMDEMTHVLVR
jgi:hypothetical protein